MRFRIHASRRAISLSSQLWGKQLTPRALTNAAQHIQPEDSLAPQRAPQFPLPIESSQPEPRTAQAIGRFLRSLYLLLRARRLYQANHPRVEESLTETDRALHAALEWAPRVAFSIEHERIVLASRSRRASAEGLAVYRSECEALAEELERRGISSMVFEKQTSRADLDAVARILAQPAAKPSGDAALAWEPQLAALRIASIRINVSVEHRAESALAGLLNALLATVGSLPAEKDPTFADRPHTVDTPQSETELATALRLLVRLAPIVQPAQEEALRESAHALHSVLAGSDRRSMTLVARTILRQAPREGEPPRLYLARVAETLILDFVARRFVARRIPPASLRTALARACHAAGEVLTEWADDSYMDALYERLWERVPVREQARVLHTRDAWCAPVGILRRTLERLAKTDADETPREARLLLLQYAGCLRSEDGKARRAVAAGLAELHPLIEQLWPRELPAGMILDVTAALADEVSPGIISLLSALTEHIARFALSVADYAGFERILDSLDAAPRDDEHAHIAALLAQVLTGERWAALVDTGVFHRSSRTSAAGDSVSRQLDPALPRVLRRDPERVLERLDQLLAAPNGLDSLPAIARLLRALGEPAIGALETRLFEPRRQRAATAVKLLAATEPARLLAALPRALPSWDWSLQDLAISELARPMYREPLPNLARTFLETLPEAHPMVVPVLLDVIGQEREAAAIPVLLEIAAGSNERLRDVFIRIKAIEALGRLRAREAAELLRSILRQRNGLTHSEPAGLRAAAEEALALIENRPSSARIRASVEALERSGETFHRPRRYLRIPLPAPLSARIAGPAAIAARVRTISLGGAYLESGRRLAVGDSLHVEIRSGLQRLRATAVVRNVAGSGGGVEFIHMKEHDRERLRRLVRRLSSN